MWLGTDTTKEKKRGSKDRMSSKKNETTDDIWRKAERIMEAVPKKAPLIHCITNPISIHDCANVILAVGGRPIMAEHPEEVREITASARSEEHTSELQSRFDLVCRLLLERKK